MGRYVGERFGREQVRSGQVIRERDVRLVIRILPRGASIADLPPPRREFGRCKAENECIAPDAEQIHPSGAALDYEPTLTDSHAVPIYRRSRIRDCHVELVVRYGDNQSLRLSPFAQRCPVEEAA